MHPAAAPKGFVPVKDAQDGYAFLYPFGWQEVSVDGQVRAAGQPACRGICRSRHACLWHACLLQQAAALAREAARAACR